MPRPKAYTQFIFDDLAYSPRTAYYGDLGLMYEIFSELTKIRLSKMMSQHDLAKKSGIAQPTIARIEAGRANPTLSQLIKIARALELKIKLEHSGTIPTPIDMD